MSTNNNNKHKINTPLINSTNPFPEKDFIHALIGIVREPLIVLDGNLQVKIANKAFYQTFQVDEAETEGKLIYELGSRQWDIPALRKLLEAILPGRESFFDFVVEHYFQNIGQRTMLLNAREIVGKNKDERVILLAIEDITISKEAGIQTSLYSGIINSTHDAVISKTLDGIITSWNKAAETIFGYSAKEIIGKNIRQLIPVQLQQEENMVIGKIKNGEVLSNYDTVRLTKDGKRINISITVSPIKDKDGNIVGASKIAHDVTEQLEGLKKLEESEQRFQNLVQEATMGIIVLTGEQMKVEIVNDAYGMLIGRSAAELLNKNLFDIIPEAENDFRPIIEGVLQSGQALYLYDTPYSILIEGKEKKGYLNLVYQPYKQPGGFVSGVMILCHDVTEQVLSRKKVEESQSRYHNMIYSSSNAIAILSGEEMIVEIANDAIIDIWGKGPDVTGKPYLEVLPELVEQGIGEMLMGVYKTGVPYHATEFAVYLNRHGNRELHYYDFVFQPQRNVANQIEGVTIIAYEVTTQAEVNKKIRESESYFRKLTDTVPTIIWITEPEGSCTYLNENWYNYTGQTEEEAAGFGWLDATHPDDAAEASRIFIEANTAQKPFSLLYRLRTKNGEYRWAKDSGSPKFGNDGIFEGYIGTVVDVHEEKIAEEKIRENERLYEAVTNNTPDLVYVFNLDYRFTYANKALLNMWGKSWHEAIGKSLLDNGYEPWHAEMHEREIDTVVATKKPIRGTVSFPHATLGKRIYDYIFAPVFGETGEVVAIAGTTRDISDIKQAEEAVKQSEKQFKDIIEAIPQMVWVCNDGGEVVYFNERWYQFTGTKPEQSLGHKWSDLVHPDDVPSTLEKWNYAQKTATPVEVEYRLKTPAGSFRWIFSHGIPILNSDGKIERWFGTCTDIDERKNFEQALKESEAFNRTVLENSPDCVKIIDTEGRLQFMNTNGLCIMEIDDFSAFQNQQWPNLWGEENRHLVSDSINKALSGETTQFQAFCATAKGTPKWWDVMVSPVTQSGTNEVQNIISVSRDITVQKEAENRVRQSEERYHNLIYSSPSAIGVLMGPDLIITTGNEAIIEIWGKGSGIIGKSYFEALPELAEQGYREVFNEVYKTGIPFNAVETPVYINQQGIITLKYYNFILYPQRDESGEVEGIGIIATEVTSQAELNKKIKESEENFRQLSELMPGLISTADPDGNVNFYSKNWETYTGTTRKELLEKGWTMLMHPEELEAIAKRWQHSIETGDDFEIELRLKNKTGDYKWHLSRAVAVKDLAGKVIKWIGSMTEIQIQKEKREELEQAVAERTKELSAANEHLVKMNKELESFTYIASHDLQEPLRKIQTFSNRILDKEDATLSETGKEYFRRMQSAAQRMQTLIEDLLAYSQSSNPTSKHELVNLEKIEEEVKEEFADTIKEKNATVEITGYCEGCINASQFRQVVFNLIGNSLKFTAAKRPPDIIIKNEIIDGSEVKNEKLQDNKKYCHVSFSDNGIGFDSQYKEQIFEVFQRLHGREEYKGTGIGLAIVKKIVENHNGIITATGELDKGARFDIYIPA